jgi:integrase
LIYRTVSQGRIHFNPFEDVKFETVERKPRFLNKGDVAKHLSFPLLDEGALRHCQYTNLRPNHRPKDCKEYGQVDRKMQD